MAGLDIADLAASGWLRDASADFRTAVLSAAMPRSYSPGTVFWQAGDAGEGLLGIVSGEAGLLHAMARPDSHVMHIVGAGFWGGNGPLLDDRPLAMTLVARSTVAALVVPRRKILAILDA